MHVTSNHKHNLVSIDNGTCFSVLNNLGTKHKEKENKGYATRYFYEYTIDEVGIDIMSGLALVHERGIFYHSFDLYSISKTKVIHKTAVPFASLEDWYVLYQLIPDREEKVEKIERYLSSKDSLNHFLLIRALEGNVPEKVRERTRKLLNYR